MLILVTIISFAVAIALPALIIDWALPPLINALDRK
jgi:hypothetical protein